MATNQQDVDQGQDPAAAGWHLDRRVPVALIMAIFFQTVSGVWWLADVSNSVANNEKAIARLQSEMRAVETDRREIYDRLARVESGVNTTNMLLTDLKELLRARGNKQGQYP